MRRVPAEGAGSVSEKRYFIQCTTEEGDLAIWWGPKA